MASIAVPSQLMIDFTEHPQGLCWCGCGGVPKNAPRNSRRLGWVKGQPIKYIQGHQRFPADASAKGVLALHKGITLPDRFWAKVDRPRSLIRCWTWTASLGKKDYGQINIKRRPAKAHRVAWELTYGPIPDGLWVLHRCDNPRCVRPSHLFLGTVTDNNRDMTAKGRHGKTPLDKVQRGAQHWTRRRPDHRPHKKLTFAQEAEIRDAVRNGATQAGLARFYGCGESTIRRAVRVER